MGSTQLGKYTLAEILGQGGFGTVYLARDGTLEVERAVKVLHPQLAADAVFLERFRREARLAARLEHVHIVPVYELDEAGGSYYLVMRHMAGGSLKELLAKEGRLAFAQAAAIVTQIAAALDFAHSQPEPVVHRDIKPGNILFEAGRAVARLSDFGFARAFSGSQSASLSASGAMIGTPAYMAPEVWDNKPVGPAADQYSLACVLFEMLTGRPLFEGDSPISILRAALSGPHFPAKWPEGVPERVAEVLGRALEGEPQRRYPTVGAFARATAQLAEPAVDASQVVCTSDEQSAEPEKGKITSEEASAKVSSGTSFSQAGRLPPDKPAGKRREVAIVIGGAVLLGLFALVVMGIPPLVSGGGAMAPEPVSSPTEVPKPTEAPAASASAEISADLIKAAQAEGQLTVIALPHDWCNYGELIEGFAKKYNLKVNELNPDAGSRDEIEAVKANKDNTGPQAPDVIDVGFGFSSQLIEEKLVMPYKVTTWDSIPENIKDAEGNWFGDYYGVLSFEVNTDVVENVPQDWADLLKPEYKGQVALAGDPRTSAQAIMSVYAAGLSNGGTLDNVMPGLEFFKKLNDAGNFVPVIAKQATVAKGETPIVIRNNYLAMADRDALAGNPEIKVVIPSANIAGVYIQAISAYAPHPNAAKLWMEYLYSDEGQLGWLKGYCYPARYNDLVKRNVIPAELQEKLPDAELVAKAGFPTIDQINNAKKVLNDNWDKVVGADVK